MIGLATQFIPPIEFPGLPNLIVSDVQVEPFEVQSPPARRAVEQAAAAFGRFLQLPVVTTWTK